MKVEQDISFGEARKKFEEQAQKQSPKSYSEVLKVPQSSSPQEEELKTRVGKLEDAVTELVGLLKQVLGKQLDPKGTDKETEPACITDSGAQGVESSGEISCIETESDSMEVQKHGDVDSDERPVTGFDKEIGKWQTVRKGKGKKGGNMPVLPALTGDDEISPSPELTRFTRAPGRGERGRLKPMQRAQSASRLPSSKQCWQNNSHPPNS